MGGRAVELTWTLLLCGACADAVGHWRDGTASPASYAAASESHLEWCDAQWSGYGDGSGDGPGDGYGYGDGYGDGSGSGYGDGDGYGDGYGDETWRDVVSITHGGVSLAGAVR